MRVSVCAPSSNFDGFRWFPTATVSSGFGAEQGQLWRVNLAWNRLGLRCRKAAGAVDCRCEVCKLCTKIVATLASAFAEGKVLSCAPPVTSRDITLNQHRLSSG